MAKDDYYVVVYKILVYLYAVLKRKIIFDEAEFKYAIEYSKINDEYFVDILHFMVDDGLIKGLTIKEVWGGFILVNDLSEMKITPIGIDYLEENKKMKKISKYVIDSVDVISSIVKLIA